MDQSKNRHPQDKFEIPRDAIVKFTNCRILFRNEIIVDDLWVRDGIIQNKSDLFFNEKISPKFEIDCGNSIISPGFIDIQINGGYGVDFSNPDISIPQDISLVAEKLLSCGVTSFCPTIISSQSNVYKKLLPLYDSYIRHSSPSSKAARVLGVHLEGPFISSDKKGMHPADAISKCENGFQDIKERYTTLDGVSIVTIAPELEGSLDVIKELRELGIKVSLGHSSGGLEIGEAGINAGANCLTHLFSCMQPFHHRDPCLIGLLASKRVSQQVFFGIIPDLIHTHAAALRLAYRINPNGLIIITDANPSMNCPDGTYRFGEQTIEINGGRSFVKGTDTLSGATTTLDQCVRNFHRVTHAGIVKTLQCVTLHPSQFLGLQGVKGTLEHGADADLVFLNDELEVKSTWLHGTLVYSTDNASYSMRAIK